MKISNRTKILITAIVILSAIIFIATLTLIKSEENLQEQSDELYYCPMHPEVTSNKPSVCPICNMNLVKKTSEEIDKTELTKLTLSESKLLLADVKTSIVRSSPVEKEIKFYTYLEIPQGNKKIISARFSGRVEKLYVNETGKFVNQGDVLFEIYSPQIIQAQNDFLLALNISDEGTDNNILSSSITKLKLLGLIDEQIEEIKSNKKLFYTIKYHSPFSGIVSQKNLIEGQYINEGMMLYELVDLSTIWAVNEVYESDLKHIKIDDIIKIKIDAYPDEEFIGRVSFISPIVNSSTRTVSIRSIISNTSNKLKPNMFGTAYIKKAIQNALLVPSTAVVMKGEVNIAWLKIDNNTFEPRLIEIGEKIDNYYTVVSGLKEGDEIVTSGAYLIDSESQFRNISLKANSNKTGHVLYYVNDNSIIPFNTVCPVLGDEIDVNVPKVFYNGKVYGFCCKGCDKKFMENPEYYSKNISSDGKKFLGN